MRPTILFAPKPVLFTLNQNLNKGIAESAGANPVDKAGMNSPVVAQGAFKPRKKKFGKTKVKKAKMEAIAKERIDNPSPVTGVTPAVASQTFYYDPTYTLDEDAVLPCGKNLYLLDTTNSLIKNYIALSECFHFAFP